MGQTGGKLNREYNLSSEKKPALKGNFSPLKRGLFYFGGSGKGIQ